MIRPIEEADNEAIKEVIQKVLTSFGANRPGFAFVDPELENMHRAYSAPRSSYYILELEGKVVGGAGIAPLKGASTDYGELVKMYFLPSARGLGYGRKIINTCLQDAIRFKFTHCYLETLQSMKTAQYLYADFGFSSLEKPFGSTGHSGCNVWMMKTL